MHSAIDNYRICYSTKLIMAFYLTKQLLAGVFQKRLDEMISKRILYLVWCPGRSLLQMKQSNDLREMCGDNYHLSLNASMVNHLVTKKHTLED